MLNQSGTVYILENSEAHRVKVGVTINNADERLKDLNRMWQGTKGRCQICLCWRLLATNGQMPKHVLSGNNCKGSNQPPLEKDTALASQQLKCFQEQLKELRANQKIAVIKRIKNLEKIIEAYLNTPNQIGIWQLHSSFTTMNAYEVEIIAHEILVEYLDVKAPFGEVFDCSTQVAVSAVQKALINVSSSLGRFNKD